MPKQNSPNKRGLEEELLEHDNQQWVLHVTEDGDTGYVGVSKKSTGKFLARMTGGKRQIVGTYDTAQQAALALAMYANRKKPREGEEREDDEEDEGNAEEGGKDDDDTRLVDEEEEGELPDLNAATADMLCAAGLTPLMSERIVEERARGGDFETSRDLRTRVRGLGDKGIGLVCRHFKLPMEAEVVDEDDKDADEEGENTVPLLQQLDDRLAHLTPEAELDRWYEAEYARMVADGVTSARVKTLAVALAAKRASVEQEVAAQAEAIRRVREALVAAEEAAREVLLPRE